ncbi:hypothetical protein CANARDRAFT_28677 [[Candida] arabinofermentans NRRL YB-2248]|uniref:Uncharacterized protein n=1 Tax=[Candida] arabinofermentans NRRL YB-2248 TaxID=983967 RepID=A0A1E4SZK0_9ASCO|nr:hypothetical protein CANARDRAFT_28677 [[Candida] arabinofermentans NRRL YB-2248]
MDMNESFLNSEQAAMLAGSGNRRGSITQLGVQVPRLTRSGSLSSEDDTLLSNESFHNYGSTAQENYVQSRRFSMLSSKLTTLNLVPSRTNDEGQVMEVETSLKTEMKMLTKSSVPLIITFLLQYSLTVASVFSVGNLGSQELAAVSLSNLLANISSYGIIQGIASSLSTLCPQAFGRKDYKAVGMHALRCTMLLFIIYIPIFAFWFWGSYPMLIALIPDPKLCDLASRYLRTLIFGVPGFIIFEVLKQFLQAQGIFQASTYVLVICAPLNVVLNYTLVWNKTFGLGFIGAPTAVVITNWCMALMLLGYTCFVRGYECWCGFSKDVFKHWKRALVLAGPGVMMIEAEWLAFEIISFASSRFGTVALASQSVVSTTCVTIYQVPFAISVAASTRIAWFIGSASKNAAIKATHSALLVGVVFGLMNAAILAIFRRSIAGLFSQDPDVIDLASRVLIIGAIYQVNDVLSCVTGGVLRGQGRQYIGGWLNLISYYLLALPVAFFCAFALNMQLFGLWIGMVIALTFVSTSQGYFVLTSDWDSIIKQSIEDGMAENYAPAATDSEDNLLRPSKSISSMIVDHNLLSPTISISGTEIGTITNLNL